MSRPAREHHRLVGDDADGMPLHPDEADDDVLCVIGLQLEELGVVADLENHLLHVVRPVRVVRHERVEGGLDPRAGIRCRAKRRRLTVARGEVAHEPAQHEQCFDVVLEGSIAHPRARGVGHRPPSSSWVTSSWVTVFTTSGPCHVHVGAVLHHEDEVGHRGGVDRAARARSHDERDLGNNPRGEHVALEDLRVPAQRGHALLDPRAARVVQADDRRAHFHRVIHDLADLLGVRLGERAAEHREVLTEHEHEPAVDGAVAGDHAVTGHAPLGHAEVDAAVLDEHVPFLERAGIEQHLDPLARSQPPLRVLRLDARRPPALPGRVALRLEGEDDLLHAGASFDGRTGRRTRSRCEAIQSARIPPEALRTHSGGRASNGNATVTVELNRLCWQAQPLGQTVSGAHRLPGAAARPACPRGGRQVDRMLPGRFVCAGCVASKGLRYTAACAARVSNGPESGCERRSRTEAGQADERSVRGRET